MGTLRELCFIVYKQWLPMPFGTRIAEQMGRTAPPFACVSLCVHGFHLGTNPLSYNLRPMAEVLLSRLPGLSLGSKHTLEFARLIVPRRAALLPVDGSSLCLVLCSSDPNFYYLSCLVCCQCVFVCLSQPCLVIFNSFQCCLSVCIEKK